MTFNFLSFLCFTVYAVDTTYKILWEVVVILIVCLLKACVKHCDDVDLVLVEAPHVGVLPGEGGDHGDLVQTHQASTQHRLHVTRLPRHGELSHKLSRVN